MGGIISNVRNKGKIEDEEEERIKKYEEATENDRYGFAFENQDDREIRWWQYLIYDVRFRVLYALSIAIIVGVVIPIIIFFTYFDKDDKTIYGSCLINENARFQCLVNNFEPATEDACIKAFCCWEENDELLFKCFHSFPSAYQYQVSDIQYSESNGNQSDSGVQLHITPNHGEIMTPLTIQIRENEASLNIKIFNPKDYPDRGWTGYKGLDKQGEMETSGLVINYGEKDGYFFIRIGRNNDSQETIFDTRLGPINSGSGFISFTTTLPTPFFYGLKGGQGIASKGTLTFGVVNGFSNAELPFYMSLEENGLWHGVLLDTSDPFMVQVVQAPGMAFYVEGPAPEINLQIFKGPSKEEVLEQLHNHVASKSNINAPPYVPPYWGLGLHLCHKSVNGTMALKHIEELDAIIPYDSDCIDENLLDSFLLDREIFDNVESIIDFLVNKASRKIVLSQKVGIKKMVNETEIHPLADILVQDKTNTSNIHPFIGVLNNQSIHYPDVFHPNFSTALTEWGFAFGHIPFSGLVLGDNFPKNENATSTCKKPESSLQNILLNGSSLTSSDPNGIGSICPNMVHTIGLGLGENLSLAGTEEKAHFEVHNMYGLEALKKLSEMALEEMKSQGREKERLLFSSSSGWTESLYHGAANGMEVPFTWIGLRESLAHTLRQFVLSPFSGTPICGSYLPNESPSEDSLLCLRWYQLGLLLPFAYHSYGHGNVSRGPLDLPQSYQGYLKAAIRQRYSYAPYYYTLSLKYKQSFVPPILPMSFHFDYTTVDKETAYTLFGLVDQFMIGEALLAAPILTSTLNRETYFPPGIWYDMDGLVAWSDSETGGFKTVTGHLTQSPLFLRGGHVLPTLQNPEGSSILQTRNGTYTLLIGLVPNSPSKGVLYLDDDLHSDSVKDEIKFEVTNTLEDDNMLLNFTMTSSNLICDLLGTSISSEVDQIKILGFPIILNNITLTVNAGPSTISPNYLPADELDMLRIYNLKLDWCTHPHIHITLRAFIDNSVL